MKKQLFRFMFFLLICLSIPLTATAQMVDIPDPNLRAAIETALGKASGATITAAEMATLTYLDSRDGDISDLTGLDYAINLTHLYLYNNSISDISAVSGLTNLTDLGLSGNSISDISAVSGLTNLTDLGLSRNSISDISAVSGLTNLTWLDLWGNSISDISAVSGLTNLTWLGFWGNLISDISGVSGLTNLTWLDLSINSISDISAVSGLTNLTWLDLGVNSISDISVVSGLTNLEVLDLSINSISDISAVSGLTNLTDLGLSINSISDISVVSGLTNLEVLDLSINSISDISAVSGLTNLTDLGLSINSISDISVVSGLTNLEVLDLGVNSISDISGVSGLTNLEVLNLGDNSISDISGVSGLTNLTDLYLSGNSISDLSPLVANTGLGDGDGVEVRQNPLSHPSIHMHIPTLTGRGVTVQFTDQAHPALLKISGDNQKGVSGAALATPFVVEVQDENGSVLEGVPVTFTVTAGGGTLSVTRIMTNENGRAESTLTLGPNPGTNTVSVSAAEFEQTVTFKVVSDTKPPPIAADVNSDGGVNILDLVLVASGFGNEGPDLAADINGDGVVNILDLVLVAGAFGNTAAAPSAQPQALETLTAADVQQWLTDARSLEVKDATMARGIVVLEQLLASLTPTETSLLPNYPNPFNPETWIPYRLAEDAFVTLTIYDGIGRVVRTLDVGHRIASAYESRSKAVYWDGRNEFGERVASSMYFYHLSAGDYSATRKMVILK